MERLFLKFHNFTEHMPPSLAVLPCARVFIPINHDVRAEGAKPGDR